jgi:iron uptake system EfeUOB component EfeO/EfeM
VGASWTAAPRAATGRAVRGVLLSLLAVTATLAVGVAVAAASGASSPERITFGNVTCAPSWPPPNPGRDTFLVVNQSSRTATVYLFRADSGRVIDTLTGLAAGASRRLTATLAPGPYAWGCDLQGYPRHVSEADKVTGHRQAGGTGPVVVPVQPNELIGPLDTYRRYVAAKIETLVTQVAALESAVDSGQPATAKSDWLTAHETWLQVGQDDGAYGAFGALGRRIDGTAAGLVGGESSPQFTGFHKLELDLWTRNDLPAARTDAAELAALVTSLSRLRLRAVLPGTKLGLINWTLRPHEVLEDALRDSLTGDDDYGSHTDLDSIAADVSVTRYLLGLLAPLLQPRAPQLVGTARRELTYLDQVITSPANDGIAIAALRRLERERVDAATDAAVETLSRVPDLLRIGNT